MLESEAPSSQSRSTTSVSRHFGSSKGGFSISEILFPIADHVCESIFIPDYFFQVFGIYSLAQVLVTSLLKGKYLDSDLLLTALFWEIETNWIPFVVFAIYTLVSVVLITCQYAIFKKSKKFSKILLYPICIAVEIIPLVIINPMMHYCGKLITIITNGGNDILDIVFLILTFVFAVVTIMEYGLISSLRGWSAILDQSPLSSFNWKIIPLMVIGNAVLNCASEIFVIFPHWFMLFLAVVAICLNVLLIYYTIYDPYIFTYTNIVVKGVLISCIVFNAIVIVDSFFNEWPEFFILGFTLSVIVAAMVISTSLYFYQHKLLNKKIHSEYDDQTFPMFRIDQSIDKGIYFLHYAMKEVAPMFYDFSLFKYLNDVYQYDKNALVKLLKIMILFPDKSREQRALLSCFTKIRKFGLPIKFMFYEIQRIKVLRQSSSSAQATDALVKLRTSSKTGETLITSMWDAPELNTTSFYDLSKNVRNLHANWEEILKMYPNCINIREEFSIFMIEVETDFQEAIRETNHCRMIESGANFSVDNCFRSFIRMHPFFLKRKIVDLKGNFIKTNAKKNGSTTSAAASISSSSTMDARLEEEIGKTILFQAKTRLALQSLTKERKPNTFQHIANFTVFSFIFAVALFVSLFVIFDSFFDGRYDDTLRSMKLNNCRTSYISTTFMILLNWAQTVVPPRFSATKYLFGDEDTIVTDFIVKGKTIDEMSIIHNSDSRSYYNDFLFDIAAGAKRGEDVYDMIPRLFYDMVNLTYCHGGYTIDPVLTDFKSLMTYTFVTQKILASTTPTWEWFNNTRYFCNVFSNAPSLSDSFRLIRNNLVKGQIGVATSKHTSLQVLSIVFPVICFLVSFFPFLVLSIIFVREINYLGVIILETESKYKKEATHKLNRIIKDSIEEKRCIEIHKKIDVPVIIYIILIGTIDAVLLILLAIMCNDTVQMNDKFKYIANWSFKSSVRVPNGFDALTFLFLGVLLSGHDKIDSTFLTASQVITIAQTQTQIIEQFRDDILFGDDISPSILGFDDEITYLLVSEKCKTNPQTGNMHDYYECGSANQLMTFFKNIETEMIKKIDEGNSTLITYNAASVYHIFVYHIQPVLTQVNKRIDDIVVNFLNVFTNNLKLYFILGLFLIVMKLALHVIMIKRLMDTYSGALTMLRRVSPLSITLNQRLFAYLLNKVESAQNEKVSVSSSIINGSSDGILCLGNAGIIELINPAIQSLLGYTPEQLLGQTIAVLFENDTIKQQLDLMLSRQAGPTYEGHLNCITDNEEKVACSVKFIAIIDDKNQINSFVVILRDETELLMRSREAEIAKAKSENLLFHILPRDIVIRLNQGEKDISFQVPSSSICFIDVVKFSEYAASLSPDEIMGNLSVLFQGFDEVVTKYQSITKIKLIGDVYMCAGGLFSPDMAPQSHAEDMVNFALDCLSSLEETNNKLNAVLSVRIGINTGGPIIAGVLGSDKPVFDIIGDPINVASRLQSTDIEGLVQVSKETFELIKELDFDVDYRGEIFLKGKGNVPTYIIKPFNHMMISSSNSRVMGSEAQLP